MINGAAVEAKSKGAMSQLSDDYDKFIKLLVAQVQNQDPLKPMDSTEFVSQTAQLAQVEQSVRSNEQMEALRSQLAVSGALSETALVGKEVTVASNDLYLGMDDATFAYQLGADATDVKALITNADGVPVRQITGLSGKGGELHDVVWDGRDDAGNEVEMGEYRVSLSSGTEGGSYTTFRTSQVDAVEFSGGNISLRLSDGRSVSSGDIVRAS
jgi:flagellar basal-body rod modification protein FlgD